MEHWIVVAATESTPLSINVCVFGICDKRIFYKIFRAICAESGDESGEKFNGEDESISVKSQSTSPDNGIALAKCRYLHEEQRIPLRDANSRTPHLVTRMKFISRETTRHYCSVPLSGGTKITNKAMVLTLHNFVEGVNIKL